MITVEEITDFKELEPFRDQWNGLVQKGPKDISLTYEWLRTLWEVHLKMCPVIVLIFRKDRQIIGIIPLYKSTEKVFWTSLRVLSPMVNLHSNHGGFLITEDFNDIIKELFAYITKKYPWHVFNPLLPTDSPEYQVLIGFLKHKGYRYLSIPGDSSPYLPLDKPMEELLKEKSPNFRSNLRRKERKMNESGKMVLKRYTSPDEVDEAIRQIFLIENKSWKVESGTSITAHEKQKCFYHSLAKKMALAGWLSIYILSFDGVPIAHDYGLVYDGRYYMVKTSYDGDYDTLSPGYVLRWLTIKEAFNQKLREYDFRWGLEDYKLSWTDKLRHHHIVYIYNKKPTSQMVYAMKEASHYVKRSMNQFPKVLIH